METAETAGMAAAATTERQLTSAGSARRRRSGPDRATVILLGLTAVLAVLALLAWQLSSSPTKTAARPVRLERRIYQTTVIETIGGGGSGTSMSQSVSSSGSASSAGPVTRSSSG